ncbi:MAG: hypothetical protein JO218_16165 [Burkholderiales bacterium]|nr:hypothetical protein [Burkholderiales bacterium]
MQRCLVAGLLSLTLVSLGATADNAPAAPAPDYTFTSNVTLASEYIYRGIAQSDNHPAVQGGFDFAHKSGFYVGTWASSISWLNDEGAGSFPMEWDFYGGYKGTIVDDLGFDVGGLEYYYPGTRNAGFVNPDTFELYGGLNYKWASFKYSRSSGNLFGAANSHGSNYFDLTLSPDLGEGWGAVAHVGRQTVAHFSLANYDDWKLGVTKDVGFGSVGLTYTGTNAKGNVGQPYYNAYGNDLGRGRVVLSFTKTM